MQAMRRSSRPRFRGRPSAYGTTVLCQLSLATIKQIGRRNVFLGVALGGLGSVVTFLVVEQAFLALKTISDALINLIPGVVILYFSYRFLRGFVKYYFRGKSFRAKMEKW